MGTGTAHHTGRWGGGSWFGKEMQAPGFISPHLLGSASNIPTSHVGKLRPQRLGTGLLSGTELALGAPSDGNSSYDRPGKKGWTAEQDAGWRNHLKTL